MPLCSGKDGKTGISVTVRNGKTEKLSLAVLPRTLKVHMLPYTAPSTWRRRGRDVHDAAVLYLLLGTGRVHYWVLGGYTTGYWVPGSQVPGSQGSQVARVPGCRVARVARVARQPRCQGAGSQGSQGSQVAKVPGCQVARVPG